MNTRLTLVAVAAAGLIALTGCKIGGGKDAASGDTPAAAPASAPRMLHRRLSQGG